MRSCPLKRQFIANTCGKTNIPDDNRTLLCWLECEPENRRAQIRDGFLAALWKVLSPTVQRMQMDTFASGLTGGEEEGLQVRNCQGRGLYQCSFRPNFTISVNFIISDKFYNPGIPGVRAVSQFLRCFTSESWKTKVCDLQRGILPYLSCLL